MKRKSTHREFWHGIALVAFWAAAVACSPSPETGALGSAEQQETVMRSEAPSPLSQDVIPPIDAASPRTLDTATFGLG